ncbi:hypothetical protein BDV12DRAFT_197224 [Aspergillus spectabilis]
MPQSTPYPNPHSQPSSDPEPFLIVIFPWICLAISFLFVTALYRKAKGFINGRARGVYTQLNDDTDGGLEGDTIIDLPATHPISKKEDKQHSQSVLHEAEEKAIEEPYLTPDDFDLDTDVLSLSEFFNPETSILYEDVLEPHSLSSTMKESRDTRGDGDLRYSDTVQIVSSLDSLVEIAVRAFKRLHETEVPSKPQPLASSDEISDFTSANVE